MCFLPPPFGEAPVWFSLLLGVVGYILPNPQLSTKYLSEKTAPSFMSLVGPDGSRKTQLILSMLASPRTFYPNVEKHNNSKGYPTSVQRNGRKTEHRISLLFGLWDDKKAEKLDASFWYSCEEIYRRKEFVKIAMDRRLKTFHWMFVEQNSFPQGKWSFTSTTHIVMFKSPRDFHQFIVFGRKLNNKELTRDCYWKKLLRKHSVICSLISILEQLPYDFAPI